MNRDIDLPLNCGKIVTLSGVRRCGKSSLMMVTINQLVERGVDRRNILWIGFDDERIIGMKTNEFDLIIQAYMEMFPDIDISDAYIFFDEIQMIPQWELFVIRVFKSYCKNIYVSGSNAEMLSSQLSTALRGWPVEYEVFPLSFKEYCRFKNIDVQSFTENNIAAIRNAFLEYNTNNSFPEIVLTDDRAVRDKTLQGYFNTMLFCDLIEHYDLKNPAAIRYFIKRVMANLSKTTSVNAIYNDMKSQGVKLAKDSL